MKQKFIDLYSKFAYDVSQLSYATRLKVGSVIVKDNRIISFGYNGTPSGWDNVCEYKFLDDNNEIVTKTLPEVIHAEANAIAKLAKSVESGQSAMMFCTHSPCIECAKQIYGAGITSLYYKEHYRSSEGVDFLYKCGIHVEKI